MQWKSSYQVKFLTKLLICRINPIWPPQFSEITSRLPTFSHKISPQENRNLVLNRQLYSSTFPTFPASQCATSSWNRVVISSFISRVPRNAERQPKLPLLVEHPRRDWEAKTSSHENVFPSAMLLALRPPTTFGKALSIRRRTQPQPENFPSKSLTRV